jgi:hypothetical protein
VERAVVDINTLDELMRDELGKVENAVDFSFALWRQDVDDSGANWNAYLRRIRGNSADTRWWEVVPKLRTVVSLVDESEGAP